MAKPRNRFLDYLTYVAVRLFAMFVHMLDMRTNYRIAQRLGDVLYLVDRRHRHRAMGHIQRSFPDWPEETVRRVAKGSMRSLVYLGLEVLLTTRYIQPGRWARYIYLTNQAENLRLLLARNRPLIYVTGHFGNWELVGYVLARFGFPTFSVARRMDNPYLDRYVFEIREHTGQTILDKRSATGMIGDLLDNNEVIGFVADQDAGRKGVFVDFFGRPASTYRSIALLAIRHEAPIVVGFGRRIDEQYKFEIGVRRIIHPDEWAGLDDPLTWITQEYTREIEEIVRAAPEQYLWVHRRWKHRPNGQAEGQDRIA